MDTREGLSHSHGELIVVLGAGGHGKVVAEALSRAMTGKPDGFVDFNQAFVGSRVMDIPVLGDEDWLWQEAGRRPVAAALGVGDHEARERLMESCLEHGIRVLTVVHPEASVAGSAIIGAGTVVFARAVLNADCRVGRGAIINSAAVVEHDVQVGEFTHVAPNAATGGGAKIGRYCQIGLGAEVLPGIAIGDQTIVGAGAVVRRDLPANVIAAGVPARILRIRESDKEVAARTTQPSAANDRIFLSAPHLSGNEQHYLLEALATNWVAPVGPHIDLFEKEFAANIGLKHAVAVSSGTAAMHLTILHLDLKPGEEVFCSTATFAASVNPVVYEGGSPVFIDSDSATWNIDCNLLADELERCAKRDKLPRAVIAVDLYGQCADWERLRSICNLYEVPIIEDAAEALGASYAGRPAGSFGWANIFSFNGNKIITTSGGGMLVTDDAVLARQARHLATQARDQAPHYEHSSIGYNYRMSNLLAGVGRAQLRVLDSRVAGRRAIFDHYVGTLGGEPGITFMPEATYGRSTRWLTCVLIDPEQFGATREDVRIHLESHNIESRPVWKPMHLQPVFKHCRRVGGDVSEGLFEYGLCLPSGTSLTLSDLNRVTSAFLSVPRRRARHIVSVSL